MPGNLDIDEIMNNAKQAAIQYQRFDQEQLDGIVKAVYQAGFNNRVKLAKLAHEETGIGIWQDKVMKNVIATRYVYYDLINLKTVGVINQNQDHSIVEIAQPIGPIFAITPITNPTSTVLFKILITLKTRNPVIIRPHGAAKKCSVEAARICYEAAVDAGAPENCVQWIKRSTKEETLEIMRHKLTALILATGSVELVKAAYSSGNPAIGIGPGNVPVYIGESADIPFAVEQILLSKLFDNGTVCASEQALIVKKINASKVIEELKKRRAYFLSPSEISRLETVAFNSAQKVMNAQVIGKPAAVIAQMADIDLPSDTSILIAPLKEVGLNSPLSLEILAPILAFYIADDFEQGIEICRNINRYGGLGHTASIFSQDEEKIEYFAKEMNAGRILVNSPASQGALGGTYNLLSPSLTLACGAGGKNITTDNITARHLINVQRIARRNVSDCMTCDHIHYFDENIHAEKIDQECTKYNLQKSGKKLL